ncbi:MAG: MarR family transcriptional regulator [Bernardetiaceae bacterium]|jgi:DNA-binding MarR family transcriptional regulator|nr:MarR family transcriptional regulator [Bernardetiaceae bacterium]
MNPDPSQLLGVSPEEQLVLTILELAAALSKRGDFISEQVGITTQQWIVLLYIYGDPNIPFIGKKQREGGFAHNSGLPPSAIADALNVSRANVSNMVNGLVDKQLVIQSQDEADHRRKLLTLTPKGIELIQTIEPHRRKANLALFSILKEKARHDLLFHLQQLLQRLHREG